MTKRESFVRVLPLVAFLMLLLLRFPFLIAAGITDIGLSDPFSIFLTATYLFTAVFIATRRADLWRFHITRTFLALFVLLPVLYLVTQWITAGTLGLLWIQPAVGLLLFLLPAKDRPGFIRSSLRHSLLWLLFSVVTGVVAGIGMGLLLQIQTPTLTPPTEPFSLSMLSAGILFQLSTAALAEEPLFRGFLPDLLRKRGLSPAMTCVAQAFLFTLAHLYYLVDGRYISLAACFAAGLLLGFTAWKSKSLVYPMIAHALINSVADLVRLYL